jgi:hypothetical protein
MGFSARKIFANDQKITRLGYLQDDTGEMVLSGSGYTVAISSGPTNNGVVKVYDWNGSSWVQKGQTISNSILEFATWFFGSNIKISSNGNRIAFTYTWAMSGANSLYAMVFDWDGSSWNQLGETIEVSINDPLRVKLISINSDASRIIISVDESDNIENKNLVFSWNGSSWVQLGSNINLTGVNNTSMDLSGNRIVFSLGFPNVSFGGFCCFSWNGSSWVQLGQKIQGTGYDEYYDSNASISPSGNMVAVSYYMINYDRYVRFFSWNGSSWVKIRDDVDVTSFDSGYSLIRINSVENIFSFIYAEGGSGAQIVYYIFYWDGIKWTRIGSGYGVAIRISGGMDLSGTIIACPFHVNFGISEARVIRYLNK